jgi:CheY-like chemotaxis protein
VLVIDDLEAMRALIRRALGAHGYQVDAAATLAEAGRLDPLGYDAILVDAHLGTERGADLVESLRSQDPSVVGRCLLITGSDPDTIPAGIACLTKPFSLPDLLAAVGLLGPGDTPLPGSPQSAAATPGPAVGPGPAPAGGSQPGDLPSAWRLLGIVRGLRARERTELADFLHDGPIQELSAAVLELQLLRRAGLPGLEPGLGRALAQLAAAGNALGSVVAGDRPLPPLGSRQAGGSGQAGDSGQAGAIGQRTGWLLAAPATVHSRADPPGLPVPGGAAVADIVELLLLRLVPVGARPAAEVTVESRGGVTGIVLTVSPASAGEPGIGDPQAARAALADLASALGATAQAEFRAREWQVSLDLPGQPAAPGS